MRCLKKLRHSNFVATAVAICFFVFMTIDHFSKENEIFRTDKYKKTGFLMKKIFPVKGGGSRIEEQLEYVPNSKKVKTILLLDEHKAWQNSGILSGKEMFLKKQCPIDTCSISYNPKTLDKADLVISRGSVVERPNLRPSQLWMVYQLESAQSRPFLNSEANWTATYRRDSTLVAPYGWWKSNNDDEEDDDDTDDSDNVVSADFAGVREGRVAWFVSNCDANNKRLEYAEQLAKHYPVDIFGKCGNLRCPRGKHSDCWKMVAKKYKFYLAFENSNCVDYITEKFWDALKFKVLPIVMGARAADYKAVAPENSFLHVDNFSSPEKLAEHLKHLDQNPALYNKHFQWVGTGKFQDTKFLCRVCSMLHHPAPVPFHSDIQDWWTSGSCTNGSWI